MRRIEVCVVVLVFCLISLALFLLGSHMGR
jgi:hypothetical protein